MDSFPNLHSVIPRVCQQRNPLSSSHLVPGEMITEMRALLQSLLKDKGIGLPPGGDDDTSGDHPKIASV